MTLDFLGSSLQLSAQSDSPDLNCRARLSEVSGVDVTDNWPSTLSQAASKPYRSQLEQ